MSCRKVVCAECATEWEGINYCAACLGKRRVQSQRGSRVPGILALLVVCALLLFSTLRLMVWSGTLLAGLL
jgi:hypothetical protein